jgi:hypothetical protein
VPAGYSTTDLLSVADPEGTALSSPIAHAQRTAARDLPYRDAWGYIKVIMRMTYFYFGYFWGFPVTGGDASEPLLK